MAKRRSSLRSSAALIGGSLRSSAALIGGNDYLLTLLLIFVPAKFLIKFQLVSKQWQSIILSPSFRRLHISRHSNSHPSLILRHKITAETFVCNPTTKTLVPIRYESKLSSEYPYIKLVHSCNGLLLLECKIYSAGTKYYHIYNPTTMQSRDLNLSKPIHGLFLAFDPRKSPHYRVVCFKRSRGLSSLLISVYDSVTHKWKDIETQLKLHREHVFRGMYWNDVICFVGSGHWYLSPQVFNPENGSVHELHVPDVPPISESKCIKRYMTESNGCMHYVNLSVKPNYNWLHVWKLSEVDLSWSNVCTVSLNPISASFGWNYHIRFLGLICGGRKEDSMVVFHVPGKIMKYNVAAWTFETLVDVTMEINDERKDRAQFQFKDAYQLLHTFSPV